jgi:serine protease AprX
MRFRVVTRVGCVAQLLTLVTLCTVAGAQTPVLDPLLQAKATLLTGQSRVVVVARDGVSLAALTLVIQGLGGTPGVLLPIINARAATLPNTALAALAASSAVEHASLDRLMVGSLNRTGATIGSTAVRQEFGLDGSGIGVAVIDSGIVAWHDDLSGTLLPPTQRVDRFVDFVSGSTAPSDPHGHGTHVAGIIAGNGFDTAGLRSGVAPNARLTVLRVLDESGRGHISDVIAALDYVVGHQTELNIRVVNLSVATGVYESYTTDPLTQAAKRAVDAGIVVVAAAGNNGRGAQGQTQYGGITAPGNAPWVLTVGASSHMGTINRADDTMAAFSSRGPTSIDHAAKPDLVAPGVGIESLSVPNSLLYNTNSAYLLPGTAATSYPPYLSLSGTSQSAPLVAGTVALMLQANPSLTPNAVKAILQYTAQVYAAYNPMTQGAGFLNAQAAVELAHYLASPATSTYPDDTLWSHQVFWGTHRIANGQINPTANAWQVGTLWGSATSADGDTVVWGTTCATECGDVWGASSANDEVVWGTSADGDTVVWGTSDGDTVVWGTNDGDTVVWGTTCDDPSCEPVIWPDGQGQ